MGDNNRTQQAAWVAISSLCSFLVGIVSPMILSRFFTVGDYGTYKQVMYVYNTLLVVFTLGLPKAYAYFVPKVPLSQAKNLIYKVTLIFFALGAIFSLFLFLCAEPIADFMGNQDLRLALRVFSPVPLLLLPTMGLDGIYASFARTQVLAVYTIITKVLTIMCIIVPVCFFDGDYIDAIIGFDIASLITCVIALYLKNWPIRHEQNEKTEVSYRQIFAFALPLLYASLWGTIIASAGQFFISRYYGNEVFAMFSNGFMENPLVGMVIGGVATVLLPAFSGMDKVREGASNREEIISLWLSSLEKSAKIIFPMLMFSIFFAELIMVCMYGDLYSNSAIYFVIKNFGGLFFIIPFAPIVIAIGKVKEYARVHMIVALLLVALLFILVNVSKTPILLAVAMEFCNFIKIYLLLRIVAQYLSKSVWQLLSINKLLPILGSSMVAGIAAFAIVSLCNVNKFAQLFIGLMIFVSIYYVCCWLLKISYRNIVVSLIGRLSNTRIVKVIP